MCQANVYYTKDQYQEQKLPSTTANTITLSVTGEEGLSNNLEERTVTKLGVIVVNIFSGVGKRLGHAGSANPIRSDPNPNRHTTTTTTI